MVTLIALATLAVSPAAVNPAKVGAPAPHFSLPDVDGKKMELSDFRGKTVVLEWFNPDCPYVKAAHTKGSLTDSAKRNMARGVVWLAVNSAAKGRQGWGPLKNREAAAAFGLKHPVLLDETGKVGRLYGATNTPHMFVINPEGVIVYAGAIDNAPDGDGQFPTGGSLINYVEAALTDIEKGRPVGTPQTKAYGCSVKYSG
jgi:peroxiredoxin